MSKRQFPFALGCVLLGLVALATGGVQPAMADLDENETATLWATEPNPCLSATEYADEHGTDPTAVQQLATCTDITFREPPATAATWTANDFQAYTPGGGDASVYPAHANRTDSPVVADAHVTPFAVHPATVVHADPDTPRRYIAPTGTIRAVIDYRTQTPTAAENVEWAVADHRVRTVTAFIDGKPVASTTETQTPVLEYDTAVTGATTLTLEAEIEVTLERTVTDANGSARTTQVERTTTVASTEDVRVYTLDAAAYTATYPSGETGIAVYQTQPWHGLDLATPDADRVRGVWRYYTAQDTRWATVTRATAPETTTEPPSATPAYVHAYPSRIGPRADPVYDGPELEAVWGVHTDSPAPTLHDNVAVDVIDDPYTQSFGLAVRVDEYDPDALRLRGVVRGVNTTLDPETATERRIREPDLEMTVTEANASAATLRVELTDPDTGAPILIDEPGLRNPIVDDPGMGTLHVAGDRVEPNASGVAVVTVTEPGVYTATYDAASWRSADPAYVDATATARWHPLTTYTGWIHLLETVIWWSIPVVVAWYAGVRLSRLLSPPSRP